MEDYPVWLGGSDLARADIVAFSRSAPRDMTTAAAVIEFADLDEATIKALEQGQYKPESSELSRVAEALGVGELELLAGPPPAI